MASFKGHLNSSRMDDIRHEDSSNLFISLIVYVNGQLACIGNDSSVIQAPISTITLEFHGMIYDISSAKLCMVVISLMLGIGEPITCISR